MPIEEINGLKIHTQSLGSSGPLAVMVHGMLIGSLSTWYFSVAATVAKEMRVLLYDLRGHGLSERPPTGYKLVTMEQDLECLLKKHADGPVTLVGHSFGAVVALRFGIDHPELVDHLVLVEPTLPIVSPFWAEAVNTRSSETVLNLFPPIQRDILMRGGRRSDRLMDQVFELGRNTTLLDDLTNEPDMTDEELANCHTPVLLCHGKDADNFTGATRERLMQVLPNVRLELFDSGHNLPLEAPHALAAAIRDFVQS